ncbi:MAG: hypothetical protein C0410_07570, partial [Anaerolinea sp.]|nr:hypothetical protein [Anaerolinea sp.]
MKNPKGEVEKTKETTTLIHAGKNSSLKKLLYFLIVEEHQSAADYVVMRLKNEGFQFDWKCATNEIDYISDLTPLPDIIITNWELPEFSGFRTLHILRERNINIPIIVFSSKIGEETAVEAMHQGAYDYLLKDHPDRLGQAVRNALNHYDQIDQWKRTESIHSLQTAALNATANAILITDCDGTIEWLNPAFTVLTGYSESEAIGKNPRDLVKSKSHDVSLYRNLWETILAGKVWKGELVNRKKNGQLYTEEQTITPVRNLKGEIIHFIAIKQDITDRKNAEEKYKKLSRIVEQSSEIVFVTNLEGVIEYVNPAFESQTGYIIADALGKTPRILKSGIHSVEEYEGLWKTILSGTILHGVVINRKKNGDLYHQETTISPLRDKEGIITHFVSTGIDITDRIKSEEERKNSYTKLEAINQISTALRRAQTLEEMLPLLLDETLKVLKITLGDIRLYNSMKNELIVAISRGYVKENEEISIPPEKPGEGIAGYVFSIGKPHISREYCLEVHLDETLRKQIPTGIGGVTVPIRTEDKIIGTITLNVFLPREITESETQLLNTLSEIAGNAIIRTNLKQKTERQLHQLTSLREIDQVILSTFDVKFSLSKILQQATSQLGVNAVDILIFNPISQTLEYLLGNGFRTRAIEHTRLRLGESHAGRAALERRLVSIPNLKLPYISPFTPSLEEEQFISFYAVPLIVKGQIKGVMEIFHRSMLEPDDDWLDFLNSLAGQAAIAIDNATLFEDLQHSNTELSLAYDATIEGWSRALDLRDEETEGHTLRVTEKTIKLASLFGISGDDLIQIRWGALLHDIGKMGVPDRILLKPGALTEEEWVIMKKHTTNAFEMLSPIRYLRSAIDIPY